MPVPAEQSWVHGFGWGVPSLWQCRAVNRGAVSLWWEHQLVTGWCWSSETSPAETRSSNPWGVTERKALLKVLQKRLKPI